MYIFSKRDVLFKRYLIGDILYFVEDDICNIVWRCLHNKPIQTNLRPPTRVWPTDQDMKFWWLLTRIKWKGVRSRVYTEYTQKITRGINGVLVAPCDLFLLLRTHNDRWRRYAIFPHKWRAFSTDDYCIFLWWRWWWWWWRRLKLL